MLNRWQRTIVDLRGNVVPYAQLQIRVESTQATATVYADKDGKDIIPNGIVTADANGYAYFYAEADLYRISSMKPTIDWRHVDIGSANAVRVATEALNENLVTYPTLAELQADTTRDVNSMGRVVNDGSNNGYYLWDGTSWVRTSYQPMQRDEFDDLVLHVENDFLRKDIEQSAPLLRDIPQVGVVGLPYDVDQLYAQIWAARYPGFPAPSAHFEFGAGARILSPDLTFSRASSAWGWRNGVLVEYEIDEPVFEDGGLRLEPQATNYVKGTEDMYANWKYNNSYYTNTPAPSIFGESYTAVKYTKIASGTPTLNLIGILPSDMYGEKVSVTILLEADLSQLSGDTIMINLHNSEEGRIHTSRRKSYQEGEAEGISLKSLNAIGPSGDPLYEIHAEFEVPNDGGTYRFYVYMFNKIGSVGVVHHFQIVRGFSYQSMIVTPSGATATRAADQFQWTGSSFDRAFNPSQGALILRPKTSPTAFSALGGWHIGLDDGKPTLRTVNMNGDTINEVQSDELDTDVRNGLGVAWTSDLLTLYANGVLIGSIPRTGTPDGLVLRKDGVLNHANMTLFSTRPTDAEMEALTHA